MQGPELIVGLDIGTTKICAVVGEVTVDSINIIGLERILLSGSEKALS